MLGQAQFVHGTDSCINDAKDKIDAEALPHHTGAEAAKRIRIGKVGVSALSQVRFFKIGKKTFRQGGSLGGSETRRIGPNWAQYSVQSPKWLGIDAEMDVRRARLLPNRQVVVDVSERMRGSCAFGGFCSHGASR